MPRTLRLRAGRLRGHSILGLDAWGRPGVALIREWSDALAASMQAPLLAQATMP